MPVGVYESATNWLINNAMNWPVSAYSTFATASLTSITNNAFGFQRLITGDPSSEGFLFLGVNNGNVATFTGAGNDGSDNGLWNDVSANSPSISILNNYSIMSMIVNGATLSPFTSGYPQNTKVGTTAAFSGFAIGGLGTTARTFSPQTWYGSIAEIISYNTNLSSSAQAIVNQYQALKWGITLQGPGDATGEVGLTGAEAQQAMASTQAGASSDGFSAFTTGYLQHLSQTSNIILAASNNINLDLQTNNLSLANGASLTISTTNGNVTSYSTGTITTNSGGAISITAGGSGVLNLNTNAVTLVANGGGAITLVSGGSTTIPVISAAGNISVSTTASGGDITVSSALAPTTAASSVTLSSFRDINVNNTITTSNGAITITSNNTGAATGGSIVVGSTITSNGGDITLNGGSGGFATGSGIASYNGITINSAVSSGSGNIVMNGNGYSAATANTGYGVYINNSVSTTGNGTITLTGTGSVLSTNALNYGIYNNGTISSVNGNITINGTGGGTGAGSNNNYGFASYWHNTTCTGTGAISITGGGGGGTGGGNAGISSGFVSTSNGNITMVGTGGAGASSWGASPSGFGTTTAGGAGKILITGTGGALGGPGIGTGGAITSNGGEIYFNGTATNNNGVQITNPFTSNGGQITLIGQGNGSNDIYTTQNLSSGGGNIYLLSQCTLSNVACGGISYNVGAASLTGNTYMYAYDTNLPAVTVNGAALVFFAGNVSTTGSVVFGGTVDANAAGVQTLTINAPSITPSGNWGSGTPLGNLTFGSAFSLGGHLLATSSGTTNITSTVNGARNLNITSATITEGGIIGGVTPLTSVTFSQTAGVLALPYNISTTGLINASTTAGNISLGATFASSAGAVTLTPSTSAIVLSANSVITAATTATIGGSVTGVASNFTVTAGNSLSLPQINTKSITATTNLASGDITTAGTQTSNGGVIAFFAYRDINISNALNTTSSANVTLTSDNASNSSGVINVTANITSNGGNIVMTGGSGYAYGRADFAGGVNITATVLSGGGNITINGNGWNNGGGNNYGISFPNASGILQTSGGSITMTGRGGGTGVTNNSFGINIVSGQLKVTAGVGTVSLTGTGSASATGGLNRGIYFNGGTISTVNGLISMTATGGINDTTSGADGMYILGGSSISTTGGAANINLTGTSGVKTMAATGVNLTSSSVSALGGVITINGTGQGTSGTGGNNNGVVIIGTTITDTTGNITVVGVGGGTAAGSSNPGVILDVAAVISTTTGAINFTGTGGAGNNGSTGLYITGGGTSLASTGNTISLFGTGGGTAGVNHGVQIDAGTAINSSGQATTITGQYGFGGKDIYLSQNIATTGTTNLVSNCSPCGTIEITNAYTLAGPMVINAGASGTAKFDSTMDGNYTLNTTAATITLGGHIGTGTKLSSATLLQTAGALSVSPYNILTQGAGGVSVTTNAGNITLGGTYSASSGPVSISPSTSAITLAADTTITASTTATIGGSVTGVASNFTVTAGNTLSLPQINTKRITATTNLAGGDITTTGTQTSHGSPIAFSAYQDININNALNTTTAANITLYSDNAGNQSGQIVINGTLTSNNGNITLSGGLTPATTSYAYGRGNGGIGILSNFNIIAGTGNILMRGHGSTTGVTNLNEGIQMNNAITVSTTGAGTITMVGIGGGVGASGQNYGIFLVATQMSAGGAISITGTGGGGTAGVNYGTYINWGTNISGAGAAGVTIVGTGGTGTGSSHGVYLSNISGAITIAPSSLISITGTGGGTAGVNHGVTIDSGTVLTSAANTTTITGQAGFGGLDIYLNQNIATTGTTTLASSCAPCGTIYINNAYSLAGNMVINAGATGTFQTNNTIDGNKTLGITANTITPNGAWGGGVALGNLTFSSAFSLGADLTATSLGTTNFTSTVNGGFNLNITSNAITQGAAIGGGVALTSATLNSTTAMLLLPHNITVTGALLAETTTGNITTSASYTSTGGSVTIFPAGASSMILAADTTINAPTITIATAIDGTVNYNESLTLISTGTITLGGAIGGSVPLKDVSITAGNTITLPAITANSIFVQTTGAAANIITGGNLNTSATSGFGLIPAATIGANNKSDYGYGVFLYPGHDLDNSGNYTITTKAATYWAVMTGDSVLTNIIKGGLVAPQYQGCSYANPITCTTPALLAANGLNAFLFASATINLTISGTSIINKVYDGTSIAYLNQGSLVGVLLADIPNVILTENGSYAQVNVGNGITVYLSASISGSAASSYTLTAPGNLIGNIYPRPLTVTGTISSDKVYDSTTSAIVTSGVLNNVVAGETLILTQGGTFASSNAGEDIEINMNDSISGVTAANYELTQPTGITANITKAPLTVIGTLAADKVYDATTAATLSGGNLSGTIYPGDAVNLSQSGNFVTKNVGESVAVIASDSVDNANYEVVQPEGLSASISKANLTVKGTKVKDKIFSINNIAELSGGELQGIYPGDDVTLVESGYFVSLNSGANPVIATDTIKGADAGNYNLIEPQGLYGQVIAKTLIDNNLASLRNMPIIQSSRSDVIILFLNNDFCYLDECKIKPKPLLDFDEFGKKKKRRRL